MEGIDVCNVCIHLYLIVLIAGGISGIYTYMNIYMGVLPRGWPQESKLDLYLYGRSAVCDFYLQAPLDQQRPQPSQAEALEICCDMIVKIDDRCPI